MRYALLISLLLTLPALAQAQPPHALLALIEQHNPELLEQRRLLDATAAGEAAGDDAGVLALLQRQERSLWRHFKLAARMGARAAPGDEGTGIDSRGALEFSLPFGDLSDKLAIAKEKQRLARAQRTQAKDEARQRLAYEQLRAALRAQVLATLAELQAAEIELAAVQTTLQRRRERRPLAERRVDAGVEPREKLWALDDEITGLEKQAALLSSQLRQQRLAVALLAGEAWREALGLLGEP